jgi:hypothetical protein
MPGLLPEGIDGSDGLCAQMRFKLCEGHFDRIEIGTVGRQEQDPGTPRLDGVLRGLALVGGQIIHDDDIAFGEVWGELFLDVGLEDAPAIGALMTKGAVSPSQRKPVMKVWVIQCPNGAFERSRRPLKQRPRRSINSS